MGTELVVPTTRELEVLSPADRWDLEDALDNAQDILRPFNDDELRRWVEVEGKSYAEVGRIVKRSRQRIAQRASRLGLQSPDPRGGERESDNPPLSNPEPPDSELVEGDVVAEPDPGPRVRCPGCGHMVKPDDIRVWRE